MKKTNLSLRHDYTTAELDDRRDELATLTLEETELRAQQKAQAADDKEDLNVLIGRKTHLARQVKARGEMRPVECLIRYNVPMSGIKQTIRLDTGELVNEGEPMTFDERQSHLFMDPELEALAKRYGGDGPIETPVDGKSAGAGEGTHGIRITEAS